MNFFRRQVHQLCEMYVSQSAVLEKYVICYYLPCVVEGSDDATEESVDNLGF